MLTLNLATVVRENTPWEFHAVLEGCLRVDPVRRFNLAEVASSLSIDPTDLDFSHSPILDELQEHFRMIDKVLVNELNYVEFLRRLESMLENRSEDLLSLKVRYLVDRNLRCRVAKLGKLHSKTNVYGLDKWDSFIRKTNFSSYLTVVTRLQQTTGTTLQ